MYLLNNYGNENKDYITHDYLINLLKKPFQAIPELINLHILIMNIQKIKI